MASKDTTVARGRWRSTDLELLPDDGVRYEIIDGERRSCRKEHSIRGETEKPG